MKCTIITERDGSRVYFPYGAPCESRLHGLFCEDKYPDHKIHITPLVRLDQCDIICDIVVAEAMHLFYKGVMCKLLILWTEGFRDLGCKMTRRQQRELSAHLRALKLPSDFQRKLRDLQYVKLWKASEFKMLLHVAGFVVLKGRINNAAYQSFMLLCLRFDANGTRFERRWKQVYIENIHENKLNFVSFFDKTNQAKPSQAKPAHFVFVPVKCQMLNSQSVSEKEQQCGTVTMGELESNIIIFRAEYIITNNCHNKITNNVSNGMVVRIELLTRD